jgi:hypothetical protein
VLTKGVSDRKPPALRSAAAMAATLVIVVTAAIPLRGFTDVKPEIERVVAFESRSASAYQKSVEQFTLGGISSEALAEIINRTILPELQAIRAGLKALDRVPAQHRRMVERAEEYLRLRHESWRLRAEGLQKHNMLTLRTADRTELASLDVLEAIMPPDQK